MTAYGSWGNIPRVQQQCYKLSRRDAALPKIEGSLLPYGKGRSYGDVCLNADNIILSTKYLDRYISFDIESGVIRCESGVGLADLLALIVPHGYFIPVTPGTRYVTLGGMLANDVHGKNHHRAGTFGCHVSQFELLRSDGSRLICSPTQNAEYYAATIGGLGLTGLITWLEIQLKPIKSSFIDEETIPFDNLAQFIAITEDSDADWEYTVAWIDAFANKKDKGKGVFFRGNHTASVNELVSAGRQRQLNVPIDFPSWVLTPPLLKLFNRAYHSLNRKGHKRVDYTKFFYPLDGIGSWNKIYGKRGFFQYQCVVPSDDASLVLNEILNICAIANAGSFLSVLKKFGPTRSPGMLSFPRAGYTLALDFPNHGDATRQMLDTLDVVVKGADGAVYPAKDARMSGESFRQYFPRWQEFTDYIDPKFSSSFWRRVMGN